MYKNMNSREIFVFTLINTILIFVNVASEDEHSSCLSNQQGILPYVKMGKGKLCPKGTEITTEEECSEALKYASDLGIAFPPFSWTKVTVGSWATLPYQCSYRAGGDNTFFFNKKYVDNPKLFLSGMNRMICTNGCIEKEQAKVIDEKLNMAEEAYSDLVLLNNSRKIKKEVLFFNRAAKVGSVSIIKLLEMYLSKQNDFAIQIDPEDTANNGKLSKKEQKWQSNLLNYLQPPMAYVRHSRFTDFRRFNKSMPIYINMVRDPIEKAISWYYYIRSAPFLDNVKRRIDPNAPSPDTNWLEKTFDSCVELGDAECNFIKGKKRKDFSQLTDFFCGHEKHCDGFNSKKAMKKAMLHVERHYAVVGVLEEFNKTLAVLEHYIPRFFKGALNMYWSNQKTLSTVNKNVKKPITSEKTKEKVRSNFTQEIEFYEFCKQRLHKQFTAIESRKQIFDQESI